MESSSSSQSKPATPRHSGGFTTEEILASNSLPLKPATPDPSDPYGGLTVGEVLAMGASESQSSSTPTMPNYEATPGERMDIAMTKMFTSALAMRASKYQSSSTPPKPKPEATPDERIDTAMTKLFSDPKSLHIQEITSLLRIKGKAVSGTKQDRLDRLLNTFGIDRKGNKVPPRDMAPSASHRLRIIPFDGEGIDPASLVGHRIQRYSLSKNEGLNLHTDQGEFSVGFEGMPFSRWADIMVDDALLEGLKPVGKIVKDRGDEDITRAEREMEEKKGGNLLILEAAVGMRKCPNFGEYRVVGFRFEGMEKMACVFSEDKVLEDYFGRDPRFGGAVLIDIGEGWEEREEAREGKKQAA